MALQTAELHITQTSPTCTRYTLVDQAGEVVWSNRIVPCPEGHAGARARMASWALKHKVTVLQAQPARVRVGRH
jgi:hypothetical protein